LWLYGKSAKVGGDMVGQVHNSLRKGMLVTAVLLGLLVSLGAGAGLVAAQGWRSRWRTFTTADGLVSNTVTAIHQTRDGALWFGTMQGLNRYDGEWESYTTADGLAHNEVTAIFQDQAGVVWIGTRGGLSSFDGVSLVSTDRLAGRDISAIGQSDDGALWFSTLDGGISHLRAGLWDAYTTSEGLPADCVTAVAQGPQGGIWVGTPLGLAHRDGDLWETYTTADGLPDNMVTDILVAADGTIWVGTLGGLSHLTLDDDGLDWDTFLPEHGLAGEHVTALLQDSENVLVVGTTRGVSLYDGQSWHTRTQRDGLVSSEVRALCEDSDGGLWFGTNGGVSHCDPTWRVYYLPQEGEEGSTASYDISALVQSDDGALWIATLGGGLVRHQDGLWDTFTSAQGLPDDNVFDLVEDRDGALWSGTAGGVGRYLAGTWETYTTAAGLPTDIVLSVEAVSDGAMWFGTAGEGVARYRPGKGWDTFTQRDGLADDYVRAIREDQDGSLWLGTSKGVNRFDGHSWQTFTSESTGGGLPGDEVRDIWRASDGSVWFATNQGAASYDGSSWQVFDRASGLPASSVNSVWTEGEDIWFGTSGGLCRTDGRTWQVYTPQNGLPSSHILSILRSGPDTWWIGTAGGGLVRHRPRRTPPWVRAIAVNERVVSAPEVILPAGERNVAVSFAGGGIHVAPEQLLYGYRLEGDSENWTYGRDRFALYYDLVPRAYTFWLVARDAGFNYSEPYSVSVVIPSIGGEAVESSPAGDAPTPVPSGATSVSSALTTGPTSMVTRSAALTGPATPQLTASALASEPSGPAPTLPAPIPESSSPAPSAPVLALRLATPAAIPSGPASSESPPAGGFAWQYGLLGLPVLAIMGVSYWGYGRWRASRAIRRDFNPYICGPPIYDEGMFFGREDLLRQVLQIIHNNNIIIYGERRIGKTTLLYQLAQRLKKLEDPDFAFFPAFINLQGIPHDRLFLLLAQGVAQEVEDAVGSLALICRSGGRGRSSPSSPGLDWRPVKTGYSNLDFQEDLTTIVEALQGTTDKEVRLILLLDEADVISSHDQIVQEQLRGVLMSSLARQVKVVLAGTYISKEWHLQSSPWYNLFSREIMLPPLDAKEVKRLIQQPVQGVYRYDQEAIRRIIAYSDRRPFEAQKLCLHAVKEALEQKKRYVTASEVEAALKSALEERGSEFEQLWEAMSSDGRRALQVLARSIGSVPDGRDHSARRETMLPKLPLSEGDRELLIRGGVLYRYQKQEHLLPSFEEWIRGEPS
jgi:ligand-binding sensor domain-containing protein/Cdc6-like AAA superfamily ATPase